MEMLELTLHSYGEEEIRAQVDDSSFMTEWMIEKRRKTDETKNRSDRVKYGYGNYYAAGYFTEGRAKRDRKSVV